MHGRTGFCSSLLLTLASALLFVGQSYATERTPQQDVFDRLQEEQQRRERRRQDDVFLPGPSADKSVPLASAEGPCFTLGSIQLEFLTEPAPVLAGLINKQTRQAKGACLTAEGIQQLHRELNASLTDKGFVTSRVLIPEQDLSSGNLHFVLVAGRIGEVLTEGISRRQVMLALPVRADGLLNLRDLEQAIENLGRVRGLQAAFDILPGAQNGESVLRMQGQQERRLGGAVILNEKYFGSTSQASALLNGEIGAPLGLTDRAVISLNTDLDTTVSDRAWGGGFDYDLGIGYWQASAGFSRQAYLNKVQGIFQRFDATGATDTTRVEVGRVLHRNNYNRINVALQASYSDVLNQIEGATIQVSSYQLSSWGARLDVNQLWRRLQLGGGITGEYSRGHGPATSLMDGESIADIDNHRILFNASVLYPFSWQRGSLQLRLNGQHSDNHLFPLQRISLAARVRGFDDISITGNSGYLVGLEYAISPAVGPGSLLLRPFVAGDLGWVPNISNEEQFHRLASVSLGSELSWKSLRAAVEGNFPVSAPSTANSDNSHVLRASLTLLL